MRPYLHLLSRFLLGLIFVISGYFKMPGFGQTRGMIAGMGVPLATVATVVAVIIEIAGGLALITGFQTRWTALILFLYLIPVTLMVHASHLGDPAQQQMQMIHVLKNLAIMGGLLKFYLDGAGALALDNRIATAEPRPSRVAV